MRNLLAVFLLLAAFSLGESYSKYGRTCQDIGCTSHEECVLQEDPCSRFKRTACGTYPTCKRVSRSASTCSNYVCPPTQVCRVEEGVPKCFNSAGLQRHKRLVQNYSGDTSPSAPSSSYNPNYPQSSNYPQNPNYPKPNYPSNYPQNPNYPQTSGGGIYPNLPAVGSAYPQPGQSGQPVQNTHQGQGYAVKQTTVRPNIYQAGQNTGSGGYRGGNAGSGYPGNPAQGSYPRQNSYPAQSGGYPGQNSGYPTQSGGYPGQNSGYPAQNSGYPGYPNQNSGYPGQSGGYPNQNSGYPSQSGGYPSQSGGYPTQSGSYPGYPRQTGGYPAQSGGYPGYSNQRGYQTQPGYQGQEGYYNQRGYSNQNSQAPKQDTGFFDKIATWGKTALKDTLNIKLK